MDQDKNTHDHEEYMCEDCGNTTPVPNEICSSCGGKMVALDAPKTPLDDDKPDLIDGDAADEAAVGSAGYEDGLEEESLEKLREEEVAEDEQEDYNYGSADDE